MDKEQRLKEVTRLLKDMERYTGKKLLPITEEQLSDVQISQEEWDKAVQQHTEQNPSYTDIEPFR